MSQIVGSFVMMIRSDRSFFLQLSTLRFIPNVYCIPVNANLDNRTFVSPMAYPRICDRRLYRGLPTYKIYFLGV